jgi:hypothetical protein
MPDLTGQMTNNDGRHHLLSFNGELSIFFPLHENRVFVLLEHGIMSCITALAVRSSFALMKSVSVSLGW